MSDHESKEYKEGKAAQKEARERNEKANKAFQEDRNRSMERAGREAFTKACADKLEVGKQGLFHPFLQAIVKIF